MKTYNPENHALWAQYLLSDPYSAEKIDGIPDFIRGVGHGSYIEGSRNYGVNTVYLGTRESQTTGTKAEIQKVRLDWDSTEKPESLRSRVWDLDGPDGEDWYEDELPHFALIGRGGLTIAGITRPGDERHAARNIVSLVGSLEDITADPIVKVLGLLTVLPGHAKDLSNTYNELVSLMPEQSLQDVA